VEFDDIPLNVDITIHVFNRLDDNFVFFVKSHALNAPPTANIGSSDEILTM
jgi:hypothetical protein